MRRMESGLPRQNRVDLPIRFLLMQANQVASPAMSTPESRRIFPLDSQDAENSRLDI